MEKLTARQSEVLQLIKDHIGETGYPPTRAEIAKQLGFKSPNAAEEHLKALARKGSIEIVAGASRGIRLPENLGLPIIGRVAAGSPILAEAHIEEYCDMPGNIFSPSADYFLRVKGDSMINVGIFDDDLLAVHRTNTVRNGQIVVARIDNEVTVKRFKQQKSKFHISLLAENPDYPPIDVDLREQDFAIEGLSVGVLRRGS
ncbi:transcriptional repressor LexA [Zhongshania sp.]|jgi:repressor LexA|uniref:transcriptional repressor LexA n=1 Tax=Zhongshania sp. TaxID=1971902 RepID=UPI0039E42894